MFLAVADGLDPVDRNPESLDELFGGTGAAVAQPEVVLGGAAFVAMALNHDGRIGEVVQDGLERRGILGERGAGVTANVCLVVIEICVLDVRRERLVDGDSRRRRCRWRRGRRRSGHVDSGRLRGGATRTGGGKGIGSGVARADATAAGALYGSNALVNRHAGDIAGDFPTQRRGLTALNRGGLRRELRNGGSGWRRRGRLDRGRRRRGRGR